MSELDRSSFSTAATELKQKLNQSVKKLAAHNFRHATQKQKESVSDFIHRLKKLFRRAYGREALTAETGDTLLNSHAVTGGTETRDYAGTYSFWGTVVCRTVCSC